ncbi:hypothetical protein G7054_g3065 [Neopestalotiopsis clavispora]|nr:hypothetical protein G7054_g3065 [Neopestalotiopsis clavispora]
MSSVTSTAAHASATAACSNLYDTPVDDAVCAMPNTGNYTTLMFSCCKEADVVSYYNGCGLYCLASGQDVQSLSNCLYGAGAAWEDVFCRGNETATATGTATGVPASASASILSSSKLHRPRSPRMELRQTERTLKVPRLSCSLEVSRLPPLWWRRCSCLLPLRKYSSKTQRE